MSEVKAERSSLTRGIINGEEEEEEEEEVEEEEEEEEEEDDEELLLLCCEEESEARMGMVFGKEMRYLSSKKLTKTDCKEPHQ
jgi:hypothetical protein